LGSAIAFQIIFKLPLWLGCLVCCFLLIRIVFHFNYAVFIKVTGFDTFTFLLLHRYGIRKLEAFFVTLIIVMLVCFFLNFVRGGIDYAGLLGGFVPEVKPYATTQAVGILGAVIMPHNIFLHSALVQTRYVDHTDLRKVAEANKYFSIEAGGALFVSFMINLAVLGVFAKGFFSPDCLYTFSMHGVNTACVPGGTADGARYGTCSLMNGKEGYCQAIGLSQAGVALSGMLGGYAEIIWAIGLLAAGQSSTMTGTYAGQFVMEGFLSLRLAPWKRVAFTRCVALVPALIVAILSENHPEESDHMDELLNVLQSIQLPFALLPVLVFTSSKKIMGTFANNTQVKLIGWSLGVVVCMINLHLVGINLAGMQFGPGIIATFFIVSSSYFSFLGFLIKTDVILFYRWMKKLVRKALR
jgi:natural resistance-associated macrophage protein